MSALSLHHPAAHVLHHRSSCFEGFKAYRRAGDGGTAMSSHLDRHIERLRQSARLLVLPEPDANLGRRAAWCACCTGRSSAAPRFRSHPAPLYLRPLLFGTTANIGAAATPAEQATLVVMASPVWDYFAGGMKPLRILMEPAPRSAPHLGVVKTGGNYAAALGPTLAARREHQADQVLFCPGGEVQETGAANFLLVREGQILTRSLDSTFLHGVTRDSLLTLAREMGYTVQERIVTVEETLDWVGNGGAALVLLPLVGHRRGARRRSRYRWSISPAGSRGPYSPNWRRGACDPGFACGAGRRAARRDAGPLRMADSGLNRP